MTAHPATRGQPPILRFAPSPTGRLHIGHALSAVIAHDRARAGGGRFLLRIEDIDGARSRPEHVTGIIDDLRWLGLDWDGPVMIQSERAGVYADALDRLRAMGLVYRCICTRAEIAASASAPQGDRPPAYPGTCRTQRVGDDDPRPGCWRLDSARAADRAGPLLWTEESAGPVAAEPQAWGDVVVARKDALASYHLAVTVDDAAQGVTAVVRGRDLFGATHIHRLLQALLDLPTPLYQHHALVTGPDGRRLAKRTAGATLADLRDQGVDPVALVATLRSGRLPIGFAFDTP